MGDLVNQFPEKKSPQFSLTSIRFLCFLKRKIPKISSLFQIHSFCHPNFFTQQDQIHGLSRTNQPIGSIYSGILFVQERQREAEAEPVSRPPLPSLQCCLQHELPSNELQEAFRVAYPGMEPKKELRFMFRVILGQEEQRG